ncbi:alginate lyase family protein [Phaeobacter sp. J2-8]|uniref:alginate lyase family protein n=1 Tax=Phaeobacter sp. J2-8 TaxID=2931394 RepID=UPI001FD5E569|nr:alginate lyase family protein [Phaeobacter sp. J2-8]MCJ7872816.1 alginate lyase family protein [Phaeobacter sp. J2-8]
MSLELGTSTAVRAQELNCPLAPAPVLSLAIESRYTDDSETRSEIDKEAEAAAIADLKPLDNFIVSLTDQANQIFAADAPHEEIADCVVHQVAEWARAGALANLDSDTTRLTIGSRLAGFALALRQVVPHGGTEDDLNAIRPWLAGLAQDQMLFWEEAAPKGAKRGNLRAWAALGGAGIADLTNDPVLRGWAGWSVDYVLCTANPDGSLPQEMSRGRLAYHYQMHAVAPLVVASKLLRDQGYHPGARCEDALERVVNFTIAEMDGGARTMEITGEAQNYFDGSREITGYNLAWLPAYLTLSPSAELTDLAASFAPLGSSKLGGDQSLIWQSETQ